MNAEVKIPLIVGVTGHRHLRGEDEPILRRTVREELKKLQKTCPHTPVKLLCSFAEGGDQLCAQEAKKLGIGLIGALPMEREEFRKDFSGQALQTFDELCDAAEELVVPLFTETAPEVPDRDFLYRQCGIYVSAHCHVLLALWDGANGIRGGCGTAEAVAFMTDNDYESPDFVPLHPDDGAVLHIMTPRQGAAGEAGAVAFLGNEERFRTMVAQTDDFNRQAAKMADKQFLPLLPEKKDALTEKMAACYAVADDLSMKNAAHYRRIMAILAVLETILALSFLLYDEADVYALLLVCGIMLVLMFACNAWARHLKCHGRYLEYRVLAESLRVQIFLRHAGCPAEVAELMPWSQQESTSWVRKALGVTVIGTAPAEKHDVREYWLQDQLDYHVRSQKKTSAQLRKNDGIVRVTLVVTIALYLGMLGFEIFCGGLFGTPALSPEKLDLWRWVLKLSVGGFSAATVFSANFYGKLSLRQKLCDHIRMEKFYRLMLKRLERSGQTDAFLTAYAKEELTENSNWFAYQRDNKPDISL